jgi:hypothetical protein
MRLIKSSEHCSSVVTANSFCTAGRQSLPCITDPHGLLDARGGDLAGFGSWSQERVLCEAYSFGELLRERVTPLLAAGIGWECFLVLAVRSAFALALGRQHLPSMWILAPAIGALSACVAARDRVAAARREAAAATGASNAFGFRAWSKQLAVTLPSHQVLRLACCRGSGPASAVASVGLLRLFGALSSCAVQAWAYRRRGAGHRSRATR